MEVMERTNMVKELTDRELEVVMTVFRSYETGLREATIYSKVIKIHNIFLSINRRIATFFAFARTQTACTNACMPTYMHSLTQTCMHEGT